MGLFTVRLAEISAERREVAGSIAAPLRLAKALCCNTA